jgi:hypothetical protein
MFFSIPKFIIKVNLFFVSVKDLSLKEEIIVIADKDSNGYGA